MCLQTTSRHFMHMTSLPSCIRIDDMQNLQVCFSTHLVSPNSDGIPRATTVKIGQDAATIPTICSSRYRQSFLQYYVEGNLPPVYICFVTFIGPPWECRDVSVRGLAENEVIFARIKSRPHVFLPTCTSSLLQAGCLPCLSKNGN